MLEGSDPGPRDAELWTAGLTESEEGNRVVGLTKSKCGGSSKWPLHLWTFMPEFRCV